MEFLGRPPGASISVLSQMLDHQPHVLQVSNLRFGMPEPKALRMCPDQFRGARDQVRRGGSGRRQSVQLIGCGSHANILPTEAGVGKDRLLV